MHSGSNALDITRSAFGGCNRLLVQYRTVGHALRTFERRSWPFGLNRVRRPAEREFRLAVAYVPIEVLESYLEDLLDLDFGEERLFIEQPGVQLSFPNLAAIALGFCILGGAFGLMADESPLLSTAVGCVLALSIFAFCLSRHQATRRMRFANILSQEISRRRGSTRDNSVRFDGLSHLTPVH